MSKWLLIFALLGSWSARDAVADEYDPLKVESTASVRSIDLAVLDVARDREIPIRVYLPPEKAGEPRGTPQPVVLFSHGLGGSRAGSPFLGVRTGAGQGRAFGFHGAALARRSRATQSEPSPGDPRAQHRVLGRLCKSARVHTPIRLGGKWQPPGSEVWRLVDGTRCYQETVKDERRGQVE